MSESEAVVLCSTANPTVRHLVRLRDNRYRRKWKRVIVDGWRETAHAIEAGLRLCGYYVDEKGHGDSEDPAIARVMGHPASLGKRRLVSEAIMDKISYGESARGVVAEFERPDESLDRLRLPESPLVLVLDRIEKPGNIGAVFRCADAAGMDAVLLSDCQDVFNPNALRNSLGAIFRVPLASGSQGEVVEFLRKHRIRIVAARVESSSELWSTDLSGSVAVVLGSEAHGLGNRWKSTVDDDGKESPIAGVRIPMAGEVDSLNVSVSAAVIAFEAVRQRRKQDSEALSPPD